MTRSTIVSEVLLFACFIVLVKGNTQTALFHSKDEFLAGEETPVWYASFDDRERSTINTERKFKYTKLETSLVRKTVDFWNSLKQNGSLPVRPAQNVDDRVGSYDEEYDAFWEDPYYTTVPAAREVVYPSVLVVMHYGDEILKTYEPKFRHSQSMERVLYALAFWSTVANSVKAFQNPRVSLRIAGIVIIGPAYTWYWGWPYSAKTYDEALCPMMDYWRTSGRKGLHLPIGSYDIVAHMTNIKPQRENDQWSDGFPVKEPILAASTPGPPCKMPDKIAGFIFYDNYAFSGLQLAIGQISKVLGGKLPGQNGEIIRKRWPIETLESVSHALRSASCMSAPKEHFPPGRPVAPILAGEIFGSEKQCEVYGYGQNANTCWNTTHWWRQTNCYSMYCSKHDDSNVPCRREGPILDGTVCNAEKTKICLGGRCIDKP